VNPADRPTAPGIDPGLDGGLAVLLPDGSVRLQPAPILPAGAGTKRDEDAAITRRARRYPDVSLLMAPEYVASPGIRRGRARSPPPGWGRDAERAGTRARTTDHVVPGRPGSTAIPDSRSKLPLEEKPDVRQRECDTHDEPADWARPAAGP
jgi:hypothetical protein